MRLDSHQHFWRYTPEQYPWMQAGWPIRRDYLPEHLEPLLEKAGLDGCVAVQARQSLEENEFLLGLADRHASVKAVVGWVDLRSSRVDEQLARFAAHPKFAGVRHVVQDEPDDNFLLGTEFQRGLGRLREYNLTYDLLIFPRQLPAALRTVASFPGQPFVLDHIAKPLIRDGVLSPWREQIRELAQFPNVVCKVSGMVTEARWIGWTEADFRPFLDVVFEAFGPRRLMYGSDWPVCLLAGEYEHVFRLVKNYAKQLPVDAQESLFGGTAAAFYLGRKS